jgi:hypothetical protein
MAIDRRDILIGFVAFAVAAPARARTRAATRRLYPQFDPDDDLHQFDTRHAEARWLRGLERFLPDSVWHYDPTFETAGGERFFRIRNLASGLTFQQLRFEPCALKVAYWDAPAAYEAFAYPVDELCVCGYAANVAARALASVTYPALVQVSSAPYFYSATSPLVELAKAPPLSRDA